jgi:hypothetical protein
MVRSMRSRPVRMLRIGFDVAAGLALPALAPERIFAAADRLACVFARPLEWIGWRPAVNHDGARGVMLREWMNAFTRRAGTFPIPIELENEGAIGRLRAEYGGLVWVSVHYVGNNLLPRLLADKGWPAMSITRVEWALWGAPGMIASIEPSPQCLVRAKRALGQAASIICEIDEPAGTRTRASANLFALAYRTRKPLVFFRGEVQGGRARVRTALASGDCPLERYLLKTRAEFDGFVRSFGGPCLDWR